MTITPATHAISINPATGEQLSVLPWAGADDSNMDERHCPITGQNKY